MSDTARHPLRPETEPGVAAAERGYVVLDGPDAIAVTMTADAAERTGHALIAAAAEARAQATPGDAG